MSTFELKSRSKIARTLGPVLSIALLSTLAACTPAGTDTTGESSSSAMMESSSAAAMESSSQAATVYMDGSYTAQGVYQSPAGGELVNVSVTLKDNVITDASFAGTATNPKSKAMQAEFASGFKAQVVGKSLDEVSVGVVNGSSLTGNGFMDAIAKIKVAAKL